MMLRRGMLRRKTDPKTGKRTLCEPEQSKCRRTLRKRHFVGNLQGKCRTLPITTSIEHRALTPTVRTPRCGHTVWGIWIIYDNILLYKNDVEDFIRG